MLYSVLGSCQCVSETLLSSSIQMVCFTCLYVCLNEQINDYDNDHNGGDDDDDDDDVNVLKRYAICMSR